MTTEIAPVAPAQQQTGGAVVRAGFFDAQSFELLQRVAKGFAASDLVPGAYRGNMANCLIALDMAQRIGAAPLMVMQNLYIVHGTPGWSAKFLIASINTSGRFSALRYEWRGTPGASDYGCRAWALERATGERLDGIWVDWSMVKAEGWDSKNGSKWRTMPDQMFLYRAAAFWVRAYAPEISMGLQTAEELQDVVDVEARDVTARPQPVHVPTPGGEIPAPPAPAAPAPAAPPATSRGKKPQTQPGLPIDDAKMVEPASAQPGPPPRTVAQVRAAIEAAKNADDAVLLLDEARSAFAGDDLAGLAAAYAAKWEV
jgi:hypothetical protein